ncbi:hypothetical protein Cob_v003063 [Colletotrichum orbiculare MAFF 240422]|uniref:Uncharacterized protein n=1 Tax=Colletotrichum orbiculare (strain 104-T / ATCC 96160 / CBS 514.97 / LARS 414 / MAFF 240422) TaxID=1213857 RepID=A0A484G0V2_COLOR|nr:hypothetical protein Cob_v003063 [Colletotrichum orbiculare MAFF 240422]
MPRRAMSLHHIPRLATAASMAPASVNQRGGTECVSRCRVKNVASRAESKSLDAMSSCLSNEAASPSHDTTSPSVCYLVPG